MVFQRRSWTRIAEIETKKFESSDIDHKKIYLLRKNWLVPHARRFKVLAPTKAHARAVNVRTIPLPRHFNYKPSSQQVNSKFKPKSFPESAGRRIWTATKKACVTATAQLVPWAKMATVLPGVVRRVRPTFRPTLSDRNSNMSWQGFESRYGYWGLWSSDIDFQINTKVWFLSWHKVWFCHHTQGTHRLPIDQDTLTTNIVSVWSNWV